MLLMFGFFAIVVFGASDVINVDVIAFIVVVIIIVDAIAVLNVDVDIKGQAVEMKKFSW